MFSAAILNRMHPSDYCSTDWVCTKDGCWTRVVGFGVNPYKPAPEPVPKKKYEYKDKPDVGPESESHV